MIYPNLPLSRRSSALGQPAPEMTAPFPVQSWSMDS